MAAFSRGCFLAHAARAGTRAFRPLCTGHQPRLFSSAPILRATNSPQKLPPQRKPSFKPQTPQPSASSPVQVYKSYSQTLAEKSNSTPLYEAPSHTMFKTACYGMGFMFFSYSAYSVFSSFESEKLNVPTFVPKIFLVTGVMLSGFATWFFLAPASLIKSITAVPGSVVRTLGTIAKGGVPELQLEVEFVKMLPVPFLATRKIYIHPQDMALPMALRPQHLDTPTAAQKRQNMLEEEGQKRQLLEYEKSHIMTAPFRHAGTAFLGLFTNTKRAFLRDGFMKVYIKDKQYKLDISGGWALDQGRALDRLVTRKL